MASKDLHPSNEVVPYLREHGPATLDELPVGKVHYGSSNHRDYLGRIHVTQSGPAKRRGSTVAIYYLYGDERRAVRKFIEEHTAYVASCMADKTNPLAENLDPIIWQMFKEEWAWGDWDAE